MASFVAEVLNSAGQMEREEINEKLSLLGRRMEELKLEIHAATTATLNSFEPTYEVTASLSEKVKATSQEMLNLSEKIETEIKGQLNISTSEFQALSRHLEQVTTVMDVLEKLTSAQQLMENISVSTSKGKYRDAAASLVLLEEAFKQPVCEREDQVKILVSVRVQVEVLKQKLIQDLTDAWKETVSWSRLQGAPTLADRKESSNASRINKDKEAEEEAQQWELLLPKCDSESEQQHLREIVTAMEALRLLNRKIQTFGRQLAQYIFLGVALRWQKVIVKETILPKGHQVVVQGAGEQSHPDVADIFSIVGNILDLLNDSLLHVQVKRCEEAGTNNGGGGGTKVTLMNLMGNEIGEKVLEGIIKECLSHAIPSTNKELESFHEIITATQKFHEKLVSLGFIQDSCRVLLDYVQNVNVLFAKKKCQDILGQARRLMTTEIHNSVQISSDASPGELTPLDKGGNPSKEKLRKIDISGDPLLSEKTFRLPTCKISTCIQELLDLAYLTLSEASSSSPQCSVQLFYTTRNIFELFCSVFPTYHSHSLANFPQLAALHHNNCMFLAHHLLTLGHQFKASLPSDISGTFVDLVQEVRTLGTSCLLDQMNKQKGITEQYLEEAQGFVAVDEENKYEAAERSLRKCLHQLVHLQNVWQDVLPTSVYHKAIGVLFNTLIAYLINSIVALEDISSDAARKLHMLLKTVDKKGASLFFSGMDSDEVRSEVKVDLLRHVAKYRKLTELQLVLNGSLQEIANRWADGMGPLANEFTASEMKQLIRALFQNTERRAAVLAKIK